MLFRSANAPEPEAEDGAQEATSSSTGRVTRTNPFETPCTSCGGVIPKDTEGVHVLGHGFYHTQCAPAQ